MQNIRRDGDSFNDSLNDSFNDSLSHFSSDSFLEYANLEHGLPGHEPDFTNIRTEGIKYTGSKDKIIPHILNLIYPLGVRTVLDGFSGTTRVSQALSKAGYQVISNDIAHWSETMSCCYLLNTKSQKHYQSMIEHLNELPGHFGWFSEHYGGDPQKKGPKRPWQLHNTLKLDSIREEIDQISRDKIEKSVLLTSLILALDKVESTLGHYCSYLKEWSDRSYKTMHLEVPTLIPSKAQNEVHQTDISQLIPKVEADLSYYDPPYGSGNQKMPPSRVRYQAYYHIWKTIIQNDQPKLFGKANRRLDSSDRQSYSPFEDFRKNSKGQFIALEAIEQLIQKTQSKWIVFSYSSGGRVPIENLIETFKAHAQIQKVQATVYKKNVMNSMRWTHQWVEKEEKSHKEYLFLLEKG